MFGEDYRCNRHQRKYLPPFFEQLDYRKFHEFVTSLMLGGLHASGKDQSRLFNSLGHVILDDQ